MNSLSPPLIRLLTAEHGITGVGLNRLQEPLREPCNQKEMKEGFYLCCM